MQKARVSFLPVVMRAALHCRCSPSLQSAHDEAGTPSSRTQAVLTTSAKQSQEAEKSAKQSAEPTDADLLSAEMNLPRLR